MTRTLSPATRQAMSLRARGHTVLGPAPMRCWAAVVTLSRKGYPPSVRDLARFLGLRGVNGVVEHLQRLRRAGLLEGDPDDYHEARTLTTRYTLEVLP